MDKTNLELENVDTESLQVAFEVGVTVTRFLEKQSEPFQEPTITIFEPITTRSKNVMWKEQNSVNCLLPRLLRKILTFLMLL